VKKIITAAVAVLYLAAAALTAKAAPEISAKAAILIEAGTGTVLFEKNADEPMLVASITKIMTALVALETCDIGGTVTVSAEAAGVEGSSLYLEAGETVPLRQLLYGMMLESGNDAAAAVACHAAGSVAAFTDLMNERAESLGCTNTHFDNPHGLDSEDHHASARDMAIISAEAMKNEEFKRIVSTKSISIGGESYKNHNKLLWNYDGAVGVKTGYTKAAGRTLVSCAERDGMMLICVTLSAPDDWDDHTILYDDAFSSWKVYKTPAVGENVVQVPVISGTKDTAAAAPRESGIMLIPADAVMTTEVEVPRFVYARVNEGDRAGTLRVFRDGKEIFTSEINYTETVDRDDTQLVSFWQRLSDRLSGR